MDAIQGPGVGFSALQAPLQAVSLGKAILEDDPDNFMIHLVQSRAVQCSVVQVPEGGDENGILERGEPGVGRDELEERSV
jgi:hypothetical protein